MSWMSSGLSCVLIVGVVGAVVVVVTEGLR